VLVAAEGGGIRAAYWTAASLANLQDEFPFLRNHVFAISGVSGGAVGAALFAKLVQLEAPPFRTWLDSVDTILSRDFLPPPLAAMFGPEILQNLVPLSAIGTDRALKLEEAFTDSFADVVRHSDHKIDRPSADLMKTDLKAQYEAAFHKAEESRLPALFFNATSENGRPVVLGPIRIPEDSGADYPNWQKIS
jgi:hypothetical protein